MRYLIEVELDWQPPDEWTVGEALSLSHLSDYDEEPEPVPGQILKMTKTTSEAGESL